MKCLLIPTLYCREFVHYEFGTNTFMRKTPNLLKFDWKITSFPNIGINSDNCIEGTICTLYCTDSTVLLNYLLSYSILVHLYM